MNSLFTFFLAFLLVLWSGLAASQSAKPISSHTEPGVNLAGAEFAPQKIPGIEGKDYQFPTQTQLAYYRSKGFKNIRLPILWERVQPQLRGVLDADYLNEIQRVLKTSELLGLKVVIDVHNYLQVKGQILDGSSKEDQQAFYDLWRRLSKNLKHYSSLKAYGLMNEPHDTLGGWHKIAQFGVDAIRTEDEKTPIYVAGAQWSTTVNWHTVNPRPFVEDPVDKIFYEAHIYFDRHSVGRYHDVDKVAYPGRVTQDVMPFVLWLDQYQQKGVIGEWGVPSNDERWLPLASEFLAVAKYYGLDWYVWAGGAWRDNYVMSLEPHQSASREGVQVKDKPLIELLEKENAIEVF
jgi:endoglucanase